MDQNHFTTDTLRKKGAHLTFEERVIIQTRLRDKQSYRSIAREIGCCVNTVRNEVKRGKVLCYNGKVERYRAADGQSTYEAHRENCGRKCDAIAKGAFLDYVQKRLQEHHWSLDACFGRALVTGEFQRGEMVCTKTLYNYVTLGLLGKIKSIDLPLRVKRKNARKRVRERKKKFGRSIDERDPSVDERQDFGHWECDLVPVSYTHLDVYKRQIISRARRMILSRSFAIMSVLFPMPSGFPKREATPNQSANPPTVAAKPK